MASLPQKLFAIGQNIGGGQERVQLSRQGSYRPTHLGTMQSGESSGQSNPLGAMGGAALAALLGQGSEPSSEAVPSFSVEGARGASERGAAEVAAGMGAGVGILPSAEELGFGQQPKSGILSKLFGG
ncbi:particle protein [Pseudomonas phage PaP_Se]|nr:particle protein [Pseudomonas phage PaP_Se]